MDFTCSIYETTEVTKAGLWRLLIYANYAYDLI